MTGTRPGGINGLQAHRSQGTVTAFHTVDDGSRELRRPPMTVNRHTRTLGAVRGMGPASVRGAPEALASAARGRPHGEQLDERLE